MSTPIITQNKHTVNQAGDSPLATPRHVVTVKMIHAAQARSIVLPTPRQSPQLPPDESPAALFEDTQEARYLYALKLVRRIDADLTRPSGSGASTNPGRHCRRGGRLLTSLDEVVRAILAGELEVD